MHQFKSSASPYLCEITLDIGRIFGVRDVNRFESSVERGVAVYGHTPNVLVFARGTYNEWDSVCKLLPVLHTGKVAICGGGIANSQVELMNEINANIKLRFFDKSQKAKARTWLLA